MADVALGGMAQPSHAPTLAGHATVPDLQGVPFVDVRGQVAEIRDELDAALRQALDGGAFVQGSEVDEFEAAYAAFSGIHHVVGVANGTDAIELTLRALDIGQGDEVIGLR